MNDKNLMKKLSTMTNEEIEKEAKRLMDDGMPKELIKPLFKDEMLLEQIKNTTDEDRERFRKSLELTLEMLNEEMENSVKRKKRLMRLEKEMLVDMVFNLEGRNQRLTNNLIEVEKICAKLKEEEE